MSELISSSDFGILAKLSRDWEILEALDEKYKIFLKDYYYFYRYCVNLQQTNKW